jgi:hypothetical protein
MSDLEAIAYWVNPGEVFGNARLSNANRLAEKDVYYLGNLGRPTGSNIDFFYRVFSSTRKRVVVSGVVDAHEWIKYFVKASPEFMEVDEHTFIFDREL